MATTKRTLAVYLDDATHDNFEKIANAAHLGKNAFAAMILAKFADLKIDHGLDALTSIPKDYFKNRPGRPTNVASESEKSELATAR